MLPRILIKSFSRLTNCPTSTPCFFNAFTMRVSSSFSTYAYHPTIDKILKSEDSDSLQAAIHEIGGLSQKNREFAIKIILNRVFSAKVALSTIDHPKLAGHLAKHPQMMLQALLFKIKQLMKALGEGQQSSQQQRTESFDAINDNFLKCFDCLKKINSTLSTKYEVMLHKRFADYNLLYLSKCISAEHRPTVLEKSKEFYVSALMKMGALIKEEQDKLKKITEATPEGEERSQEQDLKANALKENIRMLIETNSENIFHLFRAEKELSQQAKKNDQQLPENIIGLLPYFEKSLSYYQIFTKMTAYSIFYHRLKKLSLQINYYSKVMAFRKHNQNTNERKQNQTKLWSELLEELQKLYKETVEDIKIIVKEPRHMGSLQEMTLLLLNIRVHRTIRQQLSSEDLKEQLLLEVSSILQLVNFDQKRAIASHLGRVVKQMVEERQKTK